MNEIIRGLHARKSVRAFEERDIPAAEREAILLAAMAAPTAGNQQLYTILHITDQALKDRLAVTCDDQPFIAKAAMALIFLADCRRWHAAFTQAGCEPRAPGVGDLLLAVSDANIAAQNAVTAAESLGIGSCYIGDIMERREEHRELLGLPDCVFPAAMLVFGYPTRQQTERKKPARFDPRHIVRENRYHRQSANELRGLFNEKQGAQSYEQWLSAFCARKYNSDFARELTRSVAGYLEEYERIKTEA